MNLGFADIYELRNANCGEYVLVFGITGLFHYAWRYGAYCIRPNCKFDCAGSYLELL